MYKRQGNDLPLRRVEDDSLMSALASHHLAIVLTATLSVILIIISAIVALLCFIRLRRLHRLRRHDDVKYVDGVDSTFYDCSREFSCFRFQDGDVGKRLPVRESSELTKLPINVDGNVTFKEYQVCTLFSLL